VVVFEVAGIEDLDQILDLLRDDPLSTSRESDDDAVYESAFNEIAADPNNHLLVGKDGGEVVAFLQLTIMPGIARVGTRRAQIESVRVRRSRRDEGIGRQLCEWSIDLARQRGCGLIQLTTDRARPDASAFYERIGFVDSHRGMKMSLAPDEAEDSS